MWYIFITTTTTAQDVLFIIEKSVILFHFGKHITLLFTL